MVNEIVEKVAKAIAWTTLSDKGKETCDFDKSFSYSEKCKFVDMARAAIASMRDPTEEMKIAAEPYNGKVVWQSMIDAALKD